MKATITHSFHYAYSRPVELGSHRFCLRPRSDGHQRLESFNLRISPHPSKQFTLLSASNDEVIRAWFSGCTDRLTIEATSQVLTYPSPPIAECIAPTDQPLPCALSDRDRSLEGYTLGWLANGQHDYAAVQLAQEALAMSDHQPLGFLLQLVAVIRERISYSLRHTGPAWPAGRTIREGIGSCRDLAMVFIESCRCIGLPARFVSGYHLTEPPPHSYELHAWAEVYLPGAGWRGFDPSGNGEIDQQYIAISTPSDPIKAAAVQGVYVCSAAVTSNFHWSITVDSSDDLSEGSSDRNS